MSDFNTIAEFIGKTGGGRQQCVASKRMGAETDENGIHGDELKRKENASTICHFVSGIHAAQPWMWFPGLPLP